ncbi:MAG TPA: L-seryl-tRNA(Sec) selenium transferase [Thermoanaerobaculia bacterium]|nr:L-seryl-tRNA(Sec) selenium transferase [Thermoanaerobaculia bacterium]
MDALLKLPRSVEMETRYGREAVKEELRKAIAAGQVEPEELVSRSSESLERRFAPTLARAINATGVLLHTNLGRSPLSAGVREAVFRVLAGYSTLEYDPETGGRGRRLDHVRAAARDLFGAGDAIAVNNNASAIFLCLSALARGKRVLVSRGELVAIGGSFKIPEILEASGAALAEVGTTNRTTIEDYRKAIPGAAILLTVHPSNYEIRGYTRRPAPEEIAALCRDSGVPWIHDQGTGCVEPLDEFGVPGEPTVASCLADGADLVTFSGDKLFGGPQAGFVVGRADLVAAVASHPVARVVRLDKMALAALAATLAAWKTGRWRDLPIYRAAGSPLPTLEARGEKIRKALAKSAPRLRLAVVESTALFGGGTSPEKPFPSRAVSVALDSRTPDSLAGKLRGLRPPIVARIEEDRLLLDLRSIQPDEDALVEEALTRLERETAG